MRLAPRSVHALRRGLSDVEIRPLIEHNTRTSTVDPIQYNVYACREDEGLRETAEGMAGAMLIRDFRVLSVRNAPHPLSIPHSTSLPRPSDGTE